MRIAVLAGGASPEREVSLLSGRWVAGALEKRGHEVQLIDPKQTVGQGMEPNASSQEGAFLPFVRVGERPHRDWQGEPGFSLTLLERLRGMDAVFLALHGALGENGCLQAVLDCQKIPYTGSGALGSALAMDKALSKRLFRDASIPTPAWIRVSDTPLLGDVLRTRVGYPCVIKPIACGSSVGISTVEKEEDLEAALREADGWGCGVMAERRIVGRELTVAVLDGQALPVVEIRPKGKFYDYVCKYDGSTEEVCPAPISREIEARAVAFSLRAFEVLRLFGYARFDFMMDQDGGLWCLEANTLPGMTPTSLLPRAALAAGIEYGELCERMLQSAFRARE